MPEEQTVRESEEKLVRALLWFLNNPNGYIHILCASPSLFSIPPILSEYCHG